MAKGRAIRCGDDINTDLIAPSCYASLDELAAHVMERVDPSIPARARADGILVAGKNFGSGSSRESAPEALKRGGIRLIIAESFARIFFRNAINIGLPVLIAPGAARIHDGDGLSVDFHSGIIHNTATGELIHCAPLPAPIRDILNDGGLIPHLSKRMPGQ